MLNQRALTAWNSTSTNSMLQSRDVPALFGIYIHWPFCASKCPYCDFNSHVRESIDHAAWEKSYLQEIEYYAALTKGRTVHSVFFGGGTPSLMAPETVASIVTAIRRHWPVANDLEITLEANPTSVEADKFRAFADAGINRVSLGVQSLDDQQLAFLGRKHSAKEAVEAIDIASKYFDRYSFDLIYARPGQTVKDWRQELEKAMKISDGHMSLYQLTIEQGTPFYTQHKRGAFHVPDQDLAGALYEETQDMMETAGLPAYEVSNHAREGEESRHNLVYWRYGDYAGIGPGAHGRLSLPDEGKIGTRAHRAPEIWMDKVTAHGHGAHPFEHIAPDDRYTEALMMGMRLRAGVDLKQLETEAGKPWPDLLCRDKISCLVAENLVVLDDKAGRLMPTRDGLQRLNSVLAYLL